MVDRLHVENFLRINGIPPTAPDEEIKSALMTAKWHEHDVEIALMALRGEKHGGEVEVIAAHQLLHTDAHVTPDTLSKLLGVRVELGEDKVTALYKSELSHERSLMATVNFIVLAILVAFIGIFIAMYILNIGPFYSPIEHL